MFLTDWSFQSEACMKVSRKEREKRFRRQEILVAAKAVFAKKGYDGAVLEEIAERAEFSKATLYTYFKDKQDLFYAVLEDGLDRLFDRTKDIVRQDLPSLSRLRLMIRSAIEYLEEDRDFFRVLTPERAGLTDSRHPELRKRVLPKLVAFIELAAVVVRQGIDEGKIKNVDPREVANLLFGMIHSAVVWWLLEGAREPLAEKSEIILDVLLDGIQLRRGRR